MSSAGLAINLQAQRREAELMELWRRSAPYAASYPVQCAARNSDGERCQRPIHKRGEHSLLWDTQHMDFWREDA